MHTPIGHSVHNLLTTSVHNLMTLTVHEVLTLYTTSTQTQYQLTALGNSKEGRDVAKLSNAYVLLRSRCGAMEDAQPRLCQQQS